MADSSLADIIDSLRSDDSKERRRGFSDAEAYLDADQVDVGLAPSFVDALLPALSDSNPKFAQGALGLLIALVELMGEDLHPYIGGVWTPLVERLGDAKVANRERAVDLAVALSTLVVAAATALEKLRPGFGHKNWRARESTLLWFARLLAQQDAPLGLGFGLNAMLPTLMKLLEDREPPVREAAFLSMEQMHRHLGDPLLNDLQRGCLRPTTLRPLLQRLRAEPATAPSRPPELLANADADVDAHSDGMRSQSSMSDFAVPQLAPPSLSAGGGEGYGSATRAASGHTANRRQPSPSLGSARRLGSGPPSARGGGPAGGSWASAIDGGDMNGGGGSEEGVTPKPVYSERELSGEIERVAEQLRHASDWAVGAARMRARAHARTLAADVQTHLCAFPPAQRVAARRVQPRADPHLRLRPSHQACVLSSLARIYPSRPRAYACAAGILRGPHRYVRAL